MKVKISPKKSPKQAPVVDEVEEVDEFESSEKMIIRAECYPPPGMTQRQCVERLSKFFEFYHPTLGIKILKD